MVQQRIGRSLGMLVGVPGSVEPRMRVAQFRRARNHVMQQRRRPGDREVGIALLVPPAVEPAIGVAAFRRAPGQKMRHRIDAGWQPRPDSATGTRRRRRSRSISGRAPQSSAGRAAAMEAASQLRSCGMWQHAGVADDAPPPAPVPAARPGFLAASEPCQALPPDTPGPATPAPAPGIAGTTCHCEARSAEAIPRLTSVPRLIRQEIASALRASR